MGVMRKGWNVTFEIVTPESAEHGDAESRGFVSENQTLRDALEDWGGDGCHVEADCYPVDASIPPSWFTAYNVNDGTRSYYEDGEEESRGLHIPDRITVASRLRLARLIGCYGA